MGSCDDSTQELTIMQVTIELVSGAEAKPPSRSQMDRNLGALDHAIALDGLSDLDKRILEDTKTILKALQEKLPL